jgi:hypothetical protein
MQLTLRALVACASGFHIAIAARGFGPGECVSLSRSTAGTCVLHTHCGGQDVSKFDFSFDCISPAKGRETHSLGVGTFDEEEEYDTDLKCEECLPPKSSLLQRRHHSKKARRHRASTSPHKKPSGGMSLAVISVAKRRTDPHQIVWYGPENCVGTYRDDQTGKCVMMTNCQNDTQLDVYEFGLICADQDNALTRHLFGMGTFGHQETFKTDVSCSECQQLDEYMDSDKAIKKLSDTVKTMKSDLEIANAKLAKMSTHVATGGQVGPAPAPAPMSAAPATNFLAQKADVKQKEAPQDESGPQLPQPQQVVPKQQQADKPKAKQASSLGKDVTGVTDNGHEVQHVKRKASSGKPADSSVQAILAAAVQGATKRGGVPKNIAQNLAQVAAKVPAAQQQQADAPASEEQVDSDTVEIQQDSDQQSQDSQDQNSQDQNSQQEEAHQDDGQQQSDSEGEEEN